MSEQASSNQQNNVGSAWACAGAEELIELPTRSGETVRVKREIARTLLNPETVEIVSIKRSERGIIWFEVAPRVIA